MDRFSNHYEQLKQMNNLRTDSIRGFPPRPNLARKIEFFKNPALFWLSPGTAMSKYAKPFAQFFLKIPLYTALDFFGCHSVKASKTHWIT